MFFAWLSDKLKQRALTIVAQTVITIIGLVLAGYAKHSGVRYLGIFFANAGAIGLIPAILTYVSPFSFNVSFANTNAGFEQCRFALETIGFHRYYYRFGRYRRYLCDYRIPTARRSEVHPWHLGDDRLSVLHVVASGYDDYTSCAVESEIEGGKVE
jgi:hypothetical protein